MNEKITDGKSADFFRGFKTLRANFLFIFEPKLTMVAKKEMQNVEGGGGGKFRGILTQI